MPSFSSRTVVYKGLLLRPQVESFYQDLQNPLTESALCLVHQRFSTNTFPSWKLAHPYRFIAHNGEINTVRGNVNWMYARRRTMESDLIGADLDKMWPIIPHGQSDTGLRRQRARAAGAGGYSLSHAMMMLIPEAWAGNPLMDAKRKAFYEYHAALMEPWDGPASIAFTDGRQIGATLDRNGLRPARFLVTSDDMVVMASEAGVLPIPEDKIVRKWRLQPGKMLLIDLEQGRIVEDDELKRTLAEAEPYEEWLRETQYKLEELSEIPEAPTPAPSNDPSTLLDRQQAFGYTQEDIQFFLEPMSSEPDDPVGSMGTDTPIAVLSKKPKLLYNYFKQNFAQVTNPPIDPIREELVMSLVSMIGPRPNLLGQHAGTHKRLEVMQPVLTNAELEKIRSIEELLDGAFRTATIDCTWPASEGSAGLEEGARPCLRRGDRLRARRPQHPDPVRPRGLARPGADPGAAGDGGRAPSPDPPRPAHPDRPRRRIGRVREVHHFCCLAGYGAEAVNPYLAFETLEALRVQNGLPLKAYEVQKNYIKAVGKGLLKVMSKMGISTYQSYCGAQIFDAVGLHSGFVEKYFTGTATTIEGAGWQEIAEETVRRHRDAYGDNPIYRSMLDPGGDYAFRLRGEDHAWTPESVGQAAARGARQQFGRVQGLRPVDQRAERAAADHPRPDGAQVGRHAAADRGGRAGRHHRQALRHRRDVVRLDQPRGAHHARDRDEPDRRQVEHRRGRRGGGPLQAAAQRRFDALGDQAGGVGPLRRLGRVPGQCRRPADQDGAGRQARRGRPAAGPQGRREHRPRAALDAGRRPDLAAAASRHLFDRGPGAAHPRPQERQSEGRGLGEAGLRGRRRHGRRGRQQGARRPRDDLGLRGRHRRLAADLADPCRLAVGDRPGRDPADPGAERPARPHRVQVDGGLRTGRDVAIGALLGADEFGFATAPLIAAGCIMMRKCHLNTCPVGVATQDPVLRKRFTGQPEHVINYFFFVAEELREIMARLGFRTLNEMIGRVDRLDMRAPSTTGRRAASISRSCCTRRRPSRRRDLEQRAPEPRARQGLDHKLIEAAQPALEQRQPVQVELPVGNVNRTVGAMLSGEVAQRYGHAGLPEDTISVRLTGTAGQSFGAFLAHGVSLELSGDANDYVGKGLSGGRVVVRQPAGTQRDPLENIIVGNTVLYGAIAASLLRGRGRRALRGAQLGRGLRRRRAPATMAAST
jgi:glutamate synthase (NADPH/NADH) large chain